MTASARHLAVVGLILAGALTSSCERASDGSGEPWTESRARPGTTSGVAVLLLYDMEGVSGLDQWRMFDANFPEFKRGRELLTDDVNAVVAGLFDGGATRVEVVDFHGSGSSDPDVIVEKLDSRVHHVMRDESFWEYDMVETGRYDAIAVVGMHCKPGSGGFAPHTCGVGMEMEINGQTITEAEWLALLWGEAGVPLIFVSGDDRLAGDLTKLPWIEYVSVKNATSASSVTLLPRDTALAALKDGASRALRGRENARVIASVKPIKIGVRANPPASLDALDGVPGVDYRDGTVRFEAPSLVEGGPAINAVLSIASDSFAPIAYETLDSLMGLEPSLRLFWTKVSERWLGFESGTWSPERGDSAEARMYHGVD